MESQENSNVMESSVPVNLEPKVEPVVPEKLGKKPSKMNGLIMGMVILVVCLVVGLSYYVLKDNGVDLLALGKQTDTTTESDTNTDDTDTTTEEERDSDSTTCEDTGTTTSCEVSVDNEGWGLFSLPKYEFGLEIPSYSPILELGGEQVPYSWVVDHHAPITTSDSVLDNEVYGVNLKFFPTYLPSTVACGGFCVKEHEFTISIYEKKDNKTLTQIKELYVSNWNTINADEATSIEMASAKSTKWGTDVWTYTANYIEHSMNGYLLVSDDYIYDISYHISSTPTESQVIGQKVLDSMKFAE